jgi:succinate-semialdehyde dehydrogenase/glutarate-semialdehyde dehydrogenase
MTTLSTVRTRRHRLLIGGQWIDPVTGETAVLTSPATGEAVAEVGSAGPEDVDRAVAKAAEAFERHRWRTAFERASEMERVADVIDRRRDAIASHLALEHGKPLAEALGEVASAANGFRLAAAEARRLTGDTIPVEDPRKRVMTFRQPRGVVVAITPWNFPINIPVEYVGPALASGNAVILKPAPTTAGIAALLGECIVEAGVPDGLFSLLTGPSVEMASALVQHPRVAVVGFTGSSAVGAAIARLAPDKELVMELGGNGPVIVLEDADRDRAVAAIGSAAFFNAGQSCAAAERIMASDSVHDWLVDGLVELARGIQLGDPRDEGTTMGPVNNEGVAAKMDAHVDDARGRGATVAHGGRRMPDRPTRLFYEPTVLARVPDGAAVTREETFGPIAPVTAFPDDRSLLEAANASSLGLSSAVFTRDLDRAFWFAERLQTGQVTVNDTSNYWELHLPFGGWAGKSSGRGRVGGRHIFEAMTQIRSVAFDVGGGRG